MDIKEIIEELTKEVLERIEEAERAKEDAEYASEHEAAEEDSIYYQGQQDMLDLIVQKIGK